MYVYSEYIFSAYFFLSLSLSPPPYLSLTRTRKHVCIETHQCLLCTPIIVLHVKDGVLPCQRTQKNGSETRVELTPPPPSVYIHFSAPSLYITVTCRTLARMIHEGIVSPRLTHKGYAEPEVKAGAEALTPAVRYSALLLHNATRSAGLVHARVEMDAWNTTSSEEVDAALERWELMLENEELRGVPMREYPHIPGVFQYGTANECPKPGVAGIALRPQTRWLDSWQGSEQEWEETTWRLPRNRAPVEVVTIYPPLRNMLEQEMLEDRRAANRDKEHRARYGKTGGFLKALREQRMERNVPLATEDEWLRGSPNVTEYAKLAAESAEQGLLPLPLPKMNKTAVDMNNDEWIDIRTADFAAEYSKEYGDAWKKDWPLDLNEWEGLDKENARQVLDLRAFYKRERQSFVNSLADDLRLASLVMSNSSSGVSINDADTLPMTATSQPFSLTSTWSAAPGDAARGGGSAGGRRGGNAQAWAAEEEVLERVRLENEAAAELGLTPKQLLLYQEWKKSGGTEATGKGGGGGGGRVGGDALDVIERYLSGTPDMMFFDDLNSRDFANLLQEEIVVLQDDLVGLLQQQQKRELQEKEQQQVDTYVYVNVFIYAYICTYIYLYFMYICKYIYI